MHLRSVVPYVKQLLNLYWITSNPLLNVNGHFDNLMKRYIRNKSVLCHSKDKFLSQLVVMLQDNISSVKFSMHLTEDQKHYTETQKFPWGTCQ